MTNLGTQRHYYSEERQRTKTSNLPLPTSNLKNKHMKSFRLIFSIMLIISLLSCVKDGVKNTQVENYVSLLKIGKYNEFELPDFTYKDIPALLEYRNDRQRITNFPENPISSYRMNECSLGMYILWTIESIRITSAENRKSIDRYPSFAPIVMYVNKPHWVEQTNEVHTIVADAYHKWWTENTYKRFDEFKTICPLDKTDYRWNLVSNDE